MKKLIIILLSIAVMPLAYADELKFKGHIKPDPIRGTDHYLISSEDGNVKARLKPDPIRSSDSGHYIIIDIDGNESGRIRPNYQNTDSYIIKTVKDDQ